MIHLRMPLNANDTYFPPHRFGSFPWMKNWEWKNLRSMEQLRPFTMMPGGSLAQNGRWNARCGMIVGTQDIVFIVVFVGISITIMPAPIELVDMEGVMHKTSAEKCKHAVYLKKNPKFWHGIRVYDSGTICIAFAFVDHLAICADTLLSKGLISDDDKDLLLRVASGMKQITIKDFVECNRCGEMVMEFDWYEIKDRGRVRFALFCHNLPLVQRSSS